jgi:hypothetical protein
MIYAISDGASVSFDSGPWAAILARRFTEDPNVSREWIEAAIAEYGRLHESRGDKVMRSTWFAGEYPLQYRHSVERGGR